MQAQTGIWITLAVYLALIVFVGIWTGRKSKSIADFTVGGRKAGAWLSALSYGTAYFSAVMFVGYAGGTGMKYGMWGIMAGLGNAVFGSYFAWKVLARRTRDVSARLKIKTMPQYFELRYGSSAIKTFACIVIFVFMVPYSASVYKGLASVADVLLDIDYDVCMVIIAVLAALLLVLGGYLAQARADFVQGIVMMVGIAMLIFFVVRSEQVGGLAGIAEYAKGEHGFSKMSGSNHIALWATVLMTSFGTWGLPQMIQKYFGIKDDKQAKRGVLISTFFALLVAGGGYFIGSLCYRFFTLDEMQEMTQDYVVPNLLKESHLPSVLLGVVLMLLIAASVSTLCSVTLTASSTLTIDFIAPRAKLDEKKSKILIKSLCVVFIIVSYVVANTKTPILDMMSYSWGIISGSFLAPYVLALYYKKLTKGGAWCGVLGGFLTAMVPASCKILTLCGVEAAGVVKLAGFGPQFACAAMILSIVLCFIGSQIFRSEKDEKNSEFFYKGIVESE